MNISLNAGQSVPQLRNYINGQWRDCGKWFDDINPANGQLAAKVAEADKALIDDAVGAARRALQGPWGKMSAQQRADILRKVACGIENRFEEFVAAEIADTGKDLSHAKTIDIPRAAANFRAFADLVSVQGGDCFQTPTADGKGALNYTVNRPLGVVAIVSPWNLPLLLFTWKVAPALACGNCVVAKPSEETPWTATLLAEVMAEAGVPAGVFNLVHGFGPDSAGAFLTGHEDINAITFTGASATGSAIMRAAAAHVRPVSFELGGKNASLIFADCNFDEAVNGTMRSVFANCGQVCLCTERVYVERPIFDRFVAALKEKAEQIVLGRLEDADVTTGPLISQEHRDKVVSYFKLAVEEGATIITGNDIPHFGDERDNGSYVLPTIWTGLDQHSRTMQEEVFGPVCNIMPFDSEEQAVELANDTKYGLAAAIWTNDLRRAHRISPQMDAGIVWVNTWFLRDLRTPFGGVKLSGIGREGGQHSLSFYSEPVNICIKL
ncbi:2-hydroxymuconic semialdehyde dehydrogenase [Bartonella sp. HY329]|uniref:2-hydroxymuconic semialdehyde dehydrogenase n=1 Tax=unclassified Bartonella TaxID=2645622 RepID=UPI0021C8ABAE|nr:MULTISPECIES: 2-hydroxymuconic semialdehyde dehydrogenase [unclassified Bartonella]UXM95077.1 2-hydroxymuconic semialdehyde dehydrogenase [Bartonella sp. HY329]UXN09400.1 2-hydroxymuconic semialdehyde dehydrogenase [Bartonella sp. HY328]